MVYRYNGSFLWFIALMTVVSCHTAAPGSRKGSFTINLTKKDRVLSQRLFPQFTGANELPRQAPLLNNNAELEVVADGISARYLAALRDCKDIGCLAQAFKVSESEKQAVMAALKGNDAGNAMSVKPGTLVNNGVGDEIRSINYILDIYLGGEKPKYSKIDKASRLDDEAQYFLDVKQAATTIYCIAGRNGTFYQLPWLTALKVLSLNGRDEAARYEPVLGLNSAALKKAKSVDWSRYDYSAILVPGLGPQKEGVSLDPGGVRRCELAAARYKKGLAPFIIVSGGHVHPDQTPFSEAIEMRKYLTGKLGIPADAVIAEPYARHTTTNIRNAARLVFQLGLPEKMPVVIITDIAQATYIMFMKGRFLDELGYLPYDQLARTRTGEPYFIPSKEAMQINPTDPLDP